MKFNFEKTKNLIKAATIAGLVLHGEANYGQENKKNEIKDSTKKEQIQEQEQEIRIKSKESFDLQRIGEKIRHTSGHIFELKSIAQNGEYYPSFNNSLFEKEETSTSSEISGGFSNDLKINSRFGTFAETIPNNKIENLLSKYKDNIKINDNLISLEYLAQDSYFFIALNQFLEDGGKIKFGRGHYSPKPLEIEFGDEDSELTFYHELLHYIFDKENSVLSESHDNGGADHYAISSLDERFNIIQTVLKGEMPLGENIPGLYGFTLEGKAGEKIERFLQNNDIQGLNLYLVSDDFYKNYVHSGMFSPLSSINFAKNHRYFKLKLSNGNTLRIIEDYGLESADLVEKIEYGEIEGTYIDVNIKDIKKFNTEALNSYVPNSDLKNVENFLEEHKNNNGLDRAYILTPDQIHDIAYLNACNAIILENAFILAIEYSKKKNIPLEKAFREKDYKKVFQEFVDQFTLLEQNKESHFPARKNARNIVQQLIQKLL